MLVFWKALNFHDRIGQAQKKQGNLHTRRSMGSES